MIRKCSKCKRELELNEENFYHDFSKTNGYEYACKTCQKYRKAKIRLKNYLEKINELNELIAEYERIIRGE